MRSYNLKALLDTNIIIHRENTKVTNQSIGLLFYWLDKLHYTKMVHPYSIKELRKYAQSEMQELYDAKLTSYEEMHTISIQSPEFIELLNCVPKTVNDEIDNQLLYETYIRKADILITEDRRMRNKAEALGIANRVFSINSFISKVSSENPSLITYKALSVRKVYFGSIDLRDSFFDSLRESYDKFDNWFMGKSEEEAYICYDDKEKILGFLYLKTEGPGDDYGNIEPRFSPRRRLKVGTFKVDSTGFRLGERFIKIIFDNALQRNVDEIYVTLYANRDELKALSQLLQRWGFYYYGIKHNGDKEETVLIKMLKEISPQRNIKENFPNVNYSVNKYILPIKPEYHTSLLPDSVLSTENEGDYMVGAPYRYALQKVYITWGDTSFVKNGDILLFYRMGEYGKSKRYTSVITTVGVVDEIISSFASKEDYMNYCQNRSVFSKEELEYFWRTKSSTLKVLKFIYCKELNKKVTLDQLYNLKIVEMWKGPRPFHRLTDEQFNSIISISQTDLYRC